MLHGKKILLGVTGGIAAYKSAFLVRLLKKAGADVRVVMTPSATEFITPLTLSTLSENAVTSDFTEDKDAGMWNNHVEYGLWPDLMLIAPATANSIGHMVSGESNNFLLTVFLSARCPVFIAPAMDLDMYLHAAVRSNLLTLAERGVHIIDAEHGELASGLVGHGRMAEPEHIIDALNTYFLANAPLRGKKAVVTAGPTYEAIDPVRFIGNHSSGKMGFELAKKLRANGADVTVIAGPTSFALTDKTIRRIDVVSAEDMLSACKAAFADADIFVMAAAVADYRPKHIEDKKIKKKDDELLIELVRTTDILKTLGDSKKGHQLLVGFALETDNELDNAKGKLKRKNLDLIVLNSLNNEGAGFAFDTNQVTLIDRNDNISNFELKSKTDVAADVVEKIITLC